MLPLLSLICSYSLTLLHLLLLYFILFFFFLPHFVLLQLIFSLLSHFLLLLVFPVPPPPTTTFPSVPHNISLTLSSSVSLSLSYTSSSFSSSSFYLSVFGPSSSPRNTPPRFRRRIKTNFGVGEMIWPSGEIFSGRLRGV